MIKKLNIDCVRTSVVILLFLASAMASAQNKTGVINGKLVSDEKLTAGIDVVNLVNEKATISDSQGDFKIEASVGDLLVISGKNFEYMRYSVDTDDFSAPVVIKLVAKPIELEEAVVNPYARINAVDLGIIKPGQKKYTHAERRMYAATSTPVDLVANLINGKLSQLKKEIEVEKKEFYLQRLEILYTDSYYINKLKIPSEQIGSFKYFVVEDAALASSMDDKNKDLIEFELSRLAIQFLKI